MTEEIMKKGTYRDVINKQIDELGFFSKKSKSEGIYLCRGFYITKELIQNPKTEHEFFDSTMEGFAQLVKETRQNVRINVIGGKYTFLREGNYIEDKLIKYLFTRLK